MAAHARLMNEFTEDENGHNLMRWLKQLTLRDHRYDSNEIHNNSYFKLSHVTRKPVFGVCDQVRHKPACAATEAS